MPIDDRPQIALGLAQAQPRRAYSRAGPSLNKAERNPEPNPEPRPSLVSGRAPSPEEGVEMIRAELLVEHQADPRVAMPILAWNKA